MSLIDNLKRYDDHGCESCHGFRPDCWVPKTDGSDGANACCWVCAHAMLAHDMPLGGTPPDCNCPATEIYPADVLARKDRLREILGPVEDPSQELLGAPIAFKVTPALPAEGFESGKTGGTFTMFSPSYNEQGKRDAEGPVLVQTFKRVSPTRVELVSASVRPRIKRVQRVTLKKRSVG